MHDKKLTIATDNLFCWFNQYFDLKQERNEKYGKQKITFLVIAENNNRYNARHALLKISKTICIVVAM